MIVRIFVVFLAGLLVNSNPSPKSLYSVASSTSHTINYYGSKHERANFHGVSVMCYLLEGSREVSTVKLTWVICPSAKLTEIDIGFGPV